MLRAVRSSQRGCLPHFCFFDPGVQDLTAEPLAITQ
jgi:hypothetical protein